MNKNKQLCVLFGLLCCVVSLCGMEQALVCYSELPGDTTQQVMRECSDYQSVGRLGRTCKAYNRAYKNLMVCKTPESLNCFSYGCSLVKNNYDACSALLSFYAKECKSRQNSEEHSRFEHLWRYHADDRLKGVREVTGIQEPSLQDCLRVYAGDCSNISLKRKILYTQIMDSLLKRDLSTAKTILLDEEALNLFNVDRVDFSWCMECFQSKSKYMNVRPRIFVNCIDLDKDDILFKFILKFQYLSTDLIAAVESAMQNDHNNLVDKLIIKYNSYYEDLFCLLRLAVQYNCSIKEAQSLLFSREGDAGKEISYCSLVETAIEKGNSDLVTQLLMKYKNLSSKYRFLICNKALKHNCFTEELYNLLFLDGMNIIDYSSFFYVVSEAMKKGKDDLVTHLLTKYGYAAYINRFELFRSAVEHNNNMTQVVELLFADNINAVDGDGKSLLSMAFEKYNLEAVRLLLSKGINTDIMYVVEEIKHSFKIDDDRFFYRFEELRNREEDKIFLQFYIDVIQELGIDSVTERGKTFLMRAVRYYHRFWSKDVDTLINALIDKGARVDLVDDEGRTILHYCAKFSDVPVNMVEIMQKLIAKKIDVNAIDKTGKTALHYACEKIKLYTFKNSFSNMVKILLDTGANIDVCDNDGNTGLLLVANGYYSDKRDKITMAIFLLDNGANASIVNNDQKDFFHFILSEENGDLNDVFFRFILNRFKSLLRNNLTMRTVGVTTLSIGAIYYLIPYLKLHR